MDGAPFILRCAVQLAGAALILLALADVFMTVLYARAGTGLISHRLASWMWGGGRCVSRLVPRWKDRLLSFVGPVFLVFLLTVWIGLLVLGFTLIVWPALGAGVRSEIGPTPKTFMTAFYFAGGNLTTSGSGSLRPASPLYKCLAVLSSLLGVSVMTLAVSYIIQIYTALHARNSMVLGLHHASGGTGDAAALLGGLGPRDDFTHADSILAGMAAEATAVYESHHFYSVLIYFRFQEPHYAMARGMLLSMELLTLIDTALDEQRHGWLGQVASVSQFRESGMQILIEFADVYLPDGPPPVGDQDEAITQQWKRRYHAALGHLRRIGISVTCDPSAGADRYVQMRRRWDSYVMAFAKYMEHELPAIDPTGANPAETGHHREMPAPPLRAAG